MAASRAGRIHWETFRLSAQSSSQLPNPIGFGSCELDWAESRNVSQWILPARDAAIVCVTEGDLVRGRGVLARQVWPSRAAPDVGNLRGIGFQNEADGFEGVGAEAVRKAE